MALFTAARHEWESFRRVRSIRTKVEDRPLKPLPPAKMWSGPGAPAVAVLLPCRNEEVAIAQVVEDFRRALPGALIYVYDNNSQDRTAAVAAAAGAVVRHAALPGKGNVVRRMFADVNADIYVLADGDGTYDAKAAPAMIRRLADEPNTNRRVLASLCELLGANYLLASDLSSMPVLVKLRAQELDAAGAEAAIAEARVRVVALLQPDSGGHGEDAPMPARKGMTEWGNNAAMEVLHRRLNHIEHAARKVARLAARPIIDEI